MSSFRNPIGPQSPKVYWRRRAGVVAVLLLVIVVITLIATRPGAGAGATATPSPSTSSAAAAPAAVPTVAAPSSAASAAPTAAATASASPTASATAGASSGSAAAGTCTASDITLKPVTDKSSYTSLQQPQINMTITNSSTSACSIDLGSSQQVLTITSGSDTYWSSKDCQVNGTNQIVKLAAGQTLTTPAIAWDRTRSSKSTCSSTRSSVPAGGATYHLSVAVGSIQSTTSATLVLN